MTEKSSEGGTFPENRHNAVFEISGMKTSKRVETRDA